jgi:tetratricopeptide (TPR) repeat protein
MSNPTSKPPQFSINPVGKRRDFGVCALLVVVFLVFGQTFRHGFVNYDDDQYFYSNPHVKAGLTWSGVTWAFQAGYASNWHPLTWLSLMSDAQLFGPGPAGPHLTNIILHAANTVLLFLLLRRLTGAYWRSAAVAAVFAIHPLHVESVAWVSERKDVLSGFFFMLTLLMYARYVEGIQAQKAKMFYGLALVLFALGLMSKPMLVTLPFVLLLLDWWPLKRFEFSTFNSQRRTILQLALEKLPFFLLSAASCVATISAQQSAVRSIVSLPLTDRLGNASVSYVIYLAQMFWPENLAVFYPYRLDLPAWQVAGTAALLFSATLLAFLMARKLPYFPVGWFWYLGMLVPVIGLVQAGDQSHADRYTYLPQIGLYLVIAWGVNDLTAPWRHRRQLLGMVACGVMIILMVCAWKQTTYWRDGESLWRHTIACTSENYTAQNNLGYVLAAQGRTSEAIEHYQKALEIYPGYAEADINLGRVFLDEGRLDEAGEYFQRAVKVKPDSAEAHNDLGILFASQGRIAEAIENYQRAVELNPDLAEAYNNLGILFASQGRFADAVKFYQKTLELEPDYADAHNNFGILVARQGQFPEAMKHFQKALDLNGNSAEANNDLGLLLVSLGRSAEAVGFYEKALELKPDYAEAHYNLGVALVNQGRYAEAMDHFRRTLELANDHGNSMLASAVRTQIRHYETNSPLPKP